MIQTQASVSFLNNAPNITQKHGQNGVVCFPERHLLSCYRFVVGTRFSRRTHANKRVRSIAMICKDQICQLNNVHKRHKIEILCVDFFSDAKQICKILQNLKCIHFHIYNYLIRFDLTHDLNLNIQSDRKRQFRNILYSMGR